MAKYLLRYFFEPGAAVCLWSANHAARLAFGYPITAAQLHLSENSLRRIAHLCSWFDTSLDWSQPGLPSPWSAAEKQRFGTAAQLLLASVSKELGDDYEILDESQTLTQVAAPIALRNPKRPDAPALTVTANADAGTIHLCIPAHLQIQLGLDVTGQKEITLADGSRKLVPYAGPVEVRFKNRVGFTGALVLGDEVVLGAIPMQDMDLTVDARTRTIDVIPGVAAAK